MTPLGGRIREARRNAGLSQEKLAEQIGVSRQAVTKWEAGQAAPSTENLLRLAEALHRPRLPDKGRHLQYNLGMPASSYVEDDIATLRRICKEADFQ